MASLPWLKEAATGARATLPIDHPYTLQFPASVAELYQAWGRPHEAVKWRKH